MTETGKRYFSSFMSLAFRGVGLLLLQHHFSQRNSFERTFSMLQTITMLFFNLTNMTKTFAARYTGFLIHTSGKVSEATVVTDAV